MACKATHELLTCTSCRLHNFRNIVVAGHGDPNARIALVGEAPGKDEDEQGEPFIGKAGQHLDMLLGNVGLVRGQLWLTNVVKCRPPSNNLRAYPDAQVTCPTLWLMPELQALPNLKVVVTLGATAGALFFPGHTATEMSTLARSWIEGYCAIGAFHPSYSLREGEWVARSIEASLRRALTYAA